MEAGEVDYGECSSFNLAGNEEDPDTTLMPKN